MSASTRPSTIEEFQALVAQVRGRDGYTEPVAFGIGLATIADADGSVLDTWYASVNLDQNLGAAALLADIIGHDGSAGTVRLTTDHIDEMLARGSLFADELDEHPNLAVLARLRETPAAGGPLPVHRVSRCSPSSPTWGHPRWTRTTSTCVCTCCRTAWCSPTD